MLVTLDEMKTYLGIPLGDTTQDDFLNREILNISEAIYNYCGRIFELKNYTQTIYADDFDISFDTKELYMYHYPITTIDSINLITKSSDGSETTEAITDYRTKKDTAMLTRTYGNGGKQNWLYCLSGDQRLEFTYNAGYTNIPENLKSVVYSLVGERYNKNQLGVSLDFGSDVQRISIPGVLGIDFDYSLKANERISAFGMIIGDYANVLDFYRSERAVIGEIHINYVEVNP